MNYRLPGEVRAFLENEVQSDVVTNQAIRNAQWQNILEKTSLSNIMMHDGQQVNGLEPLKRKTSDPVA